MIEPAAGATRTALAFLIAAYDEEEVRRDPVVLRLHHRIAPYKVAVLPLSKKPELTARPECWRRTGALHVRLRRDPAIGSRYRRQDELGTPSASPSTSIRLEDHAVTVRDRDSMEQERIPRRGSAPTSRIACPDRSATARAQRAMVIAATMAPVMETMSAARLRVIRWNP